MLGRAAPCTCRGRSRGNSRSNSKCGLPVGWRVGSGGGGRRKPILGGLAAASMPRTPPPPAPSRLRQFSAICWNGSWGPALGVRSVFLRKTDLTPDLFRYLTDVSTKVDTYQQPRRSVRGGAVWGVSRMDAAAKPPGTDSRRPRTPTPRRPPTESPLLTLTLLLRLPASGRHYSRCRAASPAETLPDHDCSHLPECPPLAKVEELT